MYKVYGHVLVIDRVGIVLPFTVASTVSVYCKPLVTVFVPLKFRLPVPDGYHVAIQSFPCQSFTVADTGCEELSASTLTVHVAVVPLNESPGTMRIAFEMSASA